jgi:hypothetical protein
MQGCPPSCRHGASRCRLRLTPAGLDPQVIPIYGRGGNEDPRSKTKGELETVPQRPSGQRPAPVVRNPLLQPAVNVNTQQGGLGIIPTLFGLPGPNREWPDAHAQLAEGRVFSRGGLGPDSALAGRSGMSARATARQQPCPPGSDPSAFFRPSHR